MIKVSARFVFSAVLAAAVAGVSAPVAASAMSQGAMSRSTSTAYDNIRPVKTAYDNIRPVKTA